MILRPTGWLAAILLACTVHAAAQEGGEPPSLSIELNGLAPAEGACRLTFVAANRLGEDITRAAYEVALFGAVLTQVSEGRIDASGLAPLRFIDRRLRRPERSAVFDREAGRISFTGRTTTQPVVPGVQDRLSWMIQLPAIAEADPQRVRAGAAVRLMVVSAKGDAKVWTLRSRGMQQVSLPGGSVEAVNLVRESADPRDTVAEVWLDPQRHHLPVRARMTERDGEPLELLLDA